MFSHVLLQGTICTMMCGWGNLAMLESAPLYMFKMKNEVGKSSRLTCIGLYRALLLVTLRARVVTQPCGVVL